jgi:RNA polymerase sigma factor (sigma-70 family)
MTASDGELIERIRAGDRQAWADAYRLHANGVRVVARRVLGDHPPGGLSADDVVHEVFATMMRRKLPSDLVSLRGYLIVAARNVVLDAARRPSATREVATDLDQEVPPAPVADPEQLTIAAVLCGRVLEHLGALTENERYGFVQRVMMQRQRDEIARELGVTPQRVSQLVAGATAKLKRAISDVEEGPPSGPAREGPPAPRRRRR